MQQVSNHLICSFLRLLDDPTQSGLQHGREHPENVNSYVAKAVHDGVWICVSVEQQFDEPRISTQDSCTENRLQQDELSSACKSLAYKAAFVAVLHIRLGLQQSPRNVICARFMLLQGSRERRLIDNNQ